MPGPIQAVLETCLYVDDLPLAEQFYREVLGLEFHSRQDERHVFFRCGRQMLLLFDPATSAAPSSQLPLHGAHGPGHVAFAVPGESLEAWRSRLLELGVPIEKEMQWPGGGQSLYFRDPAGNSLELATPQIWNIPDDPGGV